MKYEIKVISHSLVVYLPQHIIFSTPAVLPSSLWMQNTALKNEKVANNKHRMINKKCFHQNWYWNKWLKLFIIKSFIKVNALKRKLVIYGSFRNGQLFHVFTSRAHFYTLVNQEILILSKLLILLSEQI